MYPTILAGAILRSRTGCKNFSKANYVAVSPTGESYTLTPEIFNMLAMCDGTRIYQDIPGIDEFIKNTPAYIDIISLNKNKSSINSNQIINTTDLISPCRQAIWHITRKCNMKCNHCYYLFNKHIGKQIFSKKEIKIISKNLSLLGVENVRISGGEASIDNHIEFIVHLLTQIYCIPIILNTNGWKYQESIIKILEKNPFVRGVQISLDGTKMSHNKLRGVQSYDTIVLNIEKYLKTNINVRIISMLTEEWMEENYVNDVFNTLTSLGIKDWVVEIPAMTGKWIKDTSSKIDKLLTLAQKIYFLLENGKHNIKYFSLNQIFDWPLLDNYENKTLDDVMCSHDLGLLTFGTEGVSYCTLFQKKFGKEFENMGQMNFNQNQVKKIWNTIANIRTYHTIMDNLSCRQCDLFSICQGGCPGQYKSPINFQGCDYHSRNLALVKHQLFTKIDKFNL